MTSHIEPGMLTLAEHRGVDALKALSPGCEPHRILHGNTKRGPAFVYLCDHCARLSLVDIPVSGLRNHEPGDPSDRTHLSTFALTEVIIETGAFIETDGTLRARFALHLPGEAEPTWNLSADSASDVGEAVASLLHLQERGTEPIRESISAVKGTSHLQ
ncbi:MAG: hypothetical protein QG622_2737 [Actinomycetota bacterium]|nr:hypothetical protein [Actinomycetota bacterium]